MKGGGGGGGVLAPSADNLVSAPYGSDEFIPLNEQKQVISYILLVNDLFCGDAW